VLAISKEPILKLVVLLFCGCALLLPVFSRSLPNPDTDRFDVIIAHGRILDGNGNPRFRADIGIRNARSTVRAEVRKEIETRTDWENWYVHAGRDLNNLLVVDVPPGIDPKFAGMLIAKIAQAVEPTHGRPSLTSCSTATATLTV
jgi:hypothetical protein